MDLISIEEKLAHQSIVYINNPGKASVEELKKFFDVTEIKATGQIMIKYKL